MWCRPADIGDGEDVDLKLLHMTTTAMKNKGLIFYAPEQDVYLHNVSFTWRGDTTGVLYLEQYVIDVKSAEAIYQYGSNRPLTIDAIEDNQYAIISGVNVRPRDVKLTLTPGIASLTDLTASYEAVRGDSIIRNGAEIIIDDVNDYTFTAGDQLAVPPSRFEWCS